MKLKSKFKSPFFVAFADHVRRSRASSELGILIATTRSFDILFLFFPPFFLEISRIRNSDSKRSSKDLGLNEIRGIGKKVGGMLRASLNARSVYSGFVRAVLGENRARNLVTTGKF